MEFERRKAATLASLGSTIADKSPKGSVDEPIIPLIEALNSHPAFYTTSSCSGRISILSSPALTAPGAAKKKARGGTWLYISHSPADPDEVVASLFSAGVSGNEVVFRFEPFILAVECRDVGSAGELVALAVRCGFRESGITSVGGRKRDRVIVAVRCSIRMEVPMGEEGRVLIGEEYVRFLVGVANGKMEENRRRYKAFLEAFKEAFLVADDGEVAQVEAAENEDVQNGLAGTPSCAVAINRLITSGEPMEKIYLWGHIACALDRENRRGVFVFGGFGGVGRHARRNDSLFLDVMTGALSTIDIDGSAPSPRLGHVAYVVDDFVFVIGGRADPSNTLGDVWLFDFVNKEWKLPQCTGSLFPPRHRHAAAVLGSNIYVFGGLNNDTILSSLFVLDTRNLKWEELLVSGDQPCARHSHSMVAYGSKLFMFGGYNGEKALGDLYSFDVQTNIWKREMTVGRSPHARFSHSMFVYTNFLGLLGGCPVRQHFQELAFLDLQLHAWKHVTLDFIGKELLVRSTTSVIGDDLIVIGGGAACYAFGTKFSEPLKINLLPVASLVRRLPVSPKIEKNHEHGLHNGIRGEMSVKNEGSGLENEEILSLCLEDFSSDSYKCQLDASLCILQLESSYAKLCKDILKKFGWLDPGRKVLSKGNGSLICFPVTKKFTALFLHIPIGQYSCVAKSLTMGNISLNSLSDTSALDILKDCGARILIDEVAEVRETAKSHSQRLREAVSSLIKHKGLPELLLEQLPTRWDRLGDMVVLPVTSFKDPVWESIREELWPTIARSLNSPRLARQGRVASNGTRDSTLELLVGDNGWVDHRENGILYSFDATKCMFSWGNLSEKLRMAKLNCEHEVIVDLFAGIGYFSLPFLVRAKAKLVYACEWNPHAVEALRRNLNANSVSDKCIVLEGDNRMTSPKGVADRVCLGLIPTSEGSWVTAVRALRNEGGMLHVHGNVKDTEEVSWTEHVSRSIDEIARSEGRSWEVSAEHVERVKWYAPHIRHLVADVRCRQLQ